MENLKSLPSLRFPGHDAEWSRGSLRNYAALNPKVSKLPDTFCYIDLESVDKGELVKESIIKLTDAPSRAQRLVSTNDILFQTVRPYQRNNYLFLKDQGKYVASTGYAQIRAIGSPGYLYQYIHTDVFVDKVMLRCTGTSYPSINSSDLAEVPISVPSLPEQQKIASFLTAVDVKIQQLSKKKDLLEQYKKGVMQQLFGQKLRFKDDQRNAFPDWEDKNLGDLCKITTGKLDANAMVEFGRYRFYTCAQEFYFIDDFAFDTEALIVSGNGANVGYIHYYKGKFNAYQRTYVLDGFSVNIKYVKYCLDHFLPTRIKTEKKVGNTPYIVLSTLTEMKILLPCLAEQHKIASFLSAIDDKINSVSQQIEQTRQFKKGLLQQMFV